MSTIKALLNNAPSRPGNSKNDVRPQPRLLSPLALMPPQPITPAHNLPHTLPRALHSPRTPTTNAHPLRPKPKICKDAPIFTRSPTRGPLRYPPHIYPADQPANPTSAASASTTDPSASTAAISARTRSSSACSTSNAEVTTTTNDLPAAALSQYHTSFSIFPPQSDIGLYPRHIPYNSEKGIFLHATGRDFFEVFQYTFRIPEAGAALGKKKGGVRGAAAGGAGSGDAEGDGGDETAATTTGAEEEVEIVKEQVGKTYTMLWDYNTGLVRTTPLFKSCGYGKTTPAKMLNKNVGLKEICHSITGGALVAQGYWIPYTAAKAIAATFCYSIRHALTPVFGIDFVDLCVPPQDSRFGCMLIDEAITAQCRAEAAAYRQYEIENPTERPTTTIRSRPASPRTPSPRSIMPMRLPGIGIDSSGATSAEESDIGEPDDMYVLSPAGTVANSLSPASPKFRNVWTHANVPRSTPRIEEELHSPKSVMKAFRNNKAKRQFADFDEMGPNYPFGSAYSSPGQSPKRGKVGWSKTLTMRMEGQGERDGGYDADADEMDVDGTQKQQKRKMFDDVDAARALLNLGVVRVAGRRASA